MDNFTAILGILLTILMACVIVQQKRMTDNLVRAMASLEEQGVKIKQLTEFSPMIITDTMNKNLRGSMFAILDEEGHPVCSGFFVTACGIALTAAHSCEYTRSYGRSKEVFKASTYSGRVFMLDLIAPKVGALDIAILRVSASSSAVELPNDYLSLPNVIHTHQQLLGAPVALIHGSIAWSSGSNMNQLARDNGTIITTSDSVIKYSVSSYKGHSGAALLFRGGQVIGLHSEGYNDLEQEHSERSPSKSAGAVRLDNPQIWEAVQAAKVVSTSSSSSFDDSVKRRKKRAS